jgi:hypothetical protein
MIALEAVQEESILLQNRCESDHGNCSILHYVHRDAVRTLGVCCS